MINVYDEREPHNIEAFRRLPVFYQDYITQHIYLLKQEIFQALKYTVFVPVFTSGFRSPEVNYKYGGVSDSLHLFGLAVDFVLKYRDGNPVNLSENNHLVDFIYSKVGKDNYYLLNENTHFHFQFKRG